MLRTLILCSVAVTAVMAPHAMAGDRDRDPAQVTLDVSRVDFNNPAEVQSLYSRLNAVSKIVCDSTEASEPFRANDDRWCERNAVHGAVQDLDKPLLNRLDRSQADTAVAMAKDAAATTTREH